MDEQDKKNIRAMAEGVIDELSGPGEWTGFTRDVIQIYCSRSLRFGRIESFTETMDGNSNVVEVKSKIKYLYNRGYTIHKVERKVAITYDVPFSIDQVVSIGSVNAISGEDVDEEKTHTDTGETFKSCGAYMNNDCAGYIRHNTPWRCFPGRGYYQNKPCPIFERTPELIASLSVNFGSKSLKHLNNIDSLQKAAELTFRVRGKKTLHDMIKGRLEQLEGE